jgi:hypothetical protein
MRNVHGLAVLAEELGAFAHGQVPEDDLRVIRILNPNWLGAHASPSYSRARILAALTLAYHKLKSILQIVDRHAAPRILPSPPAGS